MHDLVPVLAVDRLASCPRSAELHICPPEQILIAEQAGSTAIPWYNEAYVS